MQLRLNMETMQADGSVIPAGGTITAYEMPAGPGLRVDGFGYVHYTTNSNYDSLLAKIIVHSPSADYATLLIRARRALVETQIAGVATNLHFLAAVLADPDVASNNVSTRWIDQHALALVEAARIADDAPPSAPRPRPPTARNSFTGHEAPPGLVGVRAPMQGSVISIDVKDADVVHDGQQIAVLEAMKMQHVVLAESDGIVRNVLVAIGDVVTHGQMLVHLEPVEGVVRSLDLSGAIDLDQIRPDLAESMARHAMTLDAARPESVEQRHRAGHRTARENIDDLVDPQSFVEYGALAIAAQRNRHSVEHLRI